MSYRPPRSRPSIRDLASSPTSPSHRPAVGCGESTRSPLPSPRIYFGSAHASWPATADPCVASTHRHSRALPRPTHRRLRFSPGSRSHSSSPRTSACAKSAAAGTPVAGLVSSASVPTPVPFLGMYGTAYWLACVLYDARGSTRLRASINSLYCLFATNVMSSCLLTKRVCDPFGKPPFICHRRRLALPIRPPRVSPAVLLSPFLTRRGARSDGGAAYPSSHPPGLPAQGVRAALRPRQCRMRVRDIAPRAFHHAPAP